MTTIKNTKREEQLKLLIKRFPNAPLNYNSIWHNKFKLIGLILYLSGVKKVTHSYRFLSGNKAIENIMVDRNSIIAKPYIKSQETSQNPFQKNLLWFLLQKAEVKYCGCASSEGVSKTYVQACWQTGQEDINTIISTFNALKESFDDNQK